LVGLALQALRVCSGALHEQAPNVLLAPVADAEQVIFSTCAYWITPAFVEAG